MAVIPARGGSKSIPRKNLYPLNGIPLLAHTVRGAKACPSIDRIVVSTDCAEIANVAREEGAEVPFLRPAQISADETTDFPVFAHCLRWFEEYESYRPDIVVHLRPTSPLRTSRMIEQAIDLLVKNPGADSVRSVCEPSQNPFKMWKVGEDGFLTPLLSLGIPEQYNQPRQALPEVFWQNGYVDVAWAATLREKKSMTGDRILPLFLPASEVIDIDDLLSFRLAEEMLKEGRPRE